MRRTQLLFVGGFLGAGKTTLLKQAAHHLARSGRRVGLVTNDQAENLVDTALLREAGFGVEEVAGGCFCCRFDDLVVSSERLVAEHDPDVILAEPVGSCTDVAATVLAPFRALHGDRFRLWPYSVLVEPTRLEQMLARSGGLLSEDVRYIFDQQLAEADVIVLSKTDRLSAGALETLLARLGERYPDREIMSLSAMAGTGLEAWLDRLQALADAPGWRPRVLEAIDYDRYARGEAELGWLNLNARLHDVPGLEAEALAVQLLERFQEAAWRLGTDVAHVKLTLTDGERALYGNLVSIERGPQLKGDAPVLEGCSLVLNARVPMAPPALEALAREAIEASVGRVHFEAFECLSPARPEPTHRLSA